MEAKLIDNALDFIVRASRDLWDENLSPEQQLKYSTIELFEGIELILKARLMQEHWSLVIKDIDKYKKDALESGEFISVAFDAACERLATSCNQEVPRGARNAFDELRSLRNRYVHFSCVESRSSVLAKQMKAWHFMLDLLEKGFLKKISEDQEGLFATARAEMMQVEDFLETRYQELKSKIQEEVKNGLLAGRCPNCERISLLIGDGPPSCVVCSETWEDVEGFADDYARQGNPFWKHPKHGPDDDVAYCGHCGEKAVVPAGDDLLAQAEERLSHIDREPGQDWEVYICFACGEPTVDWWLKSCGYCGEKYFSDDPDDLCPACGRF